MCDTLNQLFGISGQVATIVQLVYMITYQVSFTQFEHFFFFMVSWTEIVGELALLYNGLSILRHFDCSRNTLKALIKDPVHILAGVKLTADTTEEQHELTTWALIAFIVSNGSVYIWAIFLPVWDSRFTGDGGLRLALSMFSLGLVLPFLYVFLNGTHLGDVDDFGSTRFKLIFSLVSLMYSMEKAFEVYILVSNEERLMAGTTGELLVGFQAVEIFSVALSLFYIWIPENDQNSNNIEEQDGPQRGVLKQRNDTKLSSFTTLEVEGGGGGDGR